ncbi:hypothetical protein SMIDD22_01944 [Streptococcus mitis]|uniref:Uncharacterized protein n=1 Tax=Streptococcus mitis TaxID=28037 RepID=A0A139R7D7_STRMT|nr:hypothetical protein SMIDD22_01944 [Streptococcus mitis]
MLIASIPVPNQSLCDLSNLFLKSASANSCFLVTSDTALKSKVGKV